MRLLGWLGFTSQIQFDETGDGFSDGASIFSDLIGELEPEVSIDAFDGGCVPLVVRF